MRPSKIKEFEEWVVSNVVRAWEKEGITKNKIAELSGFPLTNVKSYCNKYKEKQIEKKQNIVDKFLYTKWSTWTCISEKMDSLTTNTKQL